jgi:hypothetical protein
MPTETGVARRHPEPAPVDPDAQTTVDAALDALASPPDAADGRGADPGWRRRLRDQLRFVGPIVALVLGLKALVFSLGVVVRETIGDQTFPAFGDRFTFWSAWDAPHYVDIAERGYQTSGDAANFIVFLPGYPYATRMLSWLLPGDMLTAAFVLSGIASVAAAVLLAYLVRADGGDDDQATRASWFLLIFPTAYFLHIPYTESFFLTLLLGSFLAARTGHWAVAGVVGALAAVSRINGILLIPALLVEAWLQYRKTRRFDPSVLWIGVIGVGLLTYLAINQHYFGDPLHFQAVQSEHWFKHLQDPVTSIRGMIESAAGRTTNDRQMFVTQELLFLGVGLVATVLAFRFSRPSYAVWALLNLLLFASTSWIQSTPRYVITLFPIFLLLAQATRRPWVAMFATAWSFGMFVWFTTLFATGRWAF